MNKENVTLEHWQSSQKDVIFLSNHHVGKKIFYDKVKYCIDSLKKQNFEVYYEMISKYSNTQHSKENKLKFMQQYRKIRGSINRSSREHYKETTNTVFPKMMVQPTVKEWGLENNLNIDVTPVDLIHRYEELYGKIILDSIDLTTPMDSPYNRPAMLSHKKWEKIIIDYRNQHLAQEIENRGDKKILVIYGAGHQKGTFRALKKLNSTWKKRNHTKIKQVIIQ